MKNKKIKLEIEYIKDFLYNHIEWENIEIDAKTTNLDNLHFNDLQKLAYNYGY